VSGATAPWRGWSARAGLFFSEPFEVWLAVAALVSGTSVLLGVGAPSSLAHQLSPWVLRSWGGGLCLGAAVTLAARWRVSAARTQGALEAANRLETLGMILFAGAAGMYAAAVLALGTAGLSGGLIIASWSAACAHRARIIVRAWRGINAGRRAAARGDATDG